MGLWSRVPAKFHVTASTRCSSKVRVEVLKRLVKNSQKIMIFEVINDFIYYLRP